MVWTGFHGLTAVLTCVTEPRKPKSKWNVLYKLNDCDLLKEASAAKSSNSKYYIMLVVSGGSLSLVSCVPPRNL